jgi:hypothetical protein
MIFPVVSLVARINNLCLYSLEGSVEEPEEITEAANTEVSIYIIIHNFFLLFRMKTL